MITGAPLFLQPYRDSEDLLQGVLEQLEGRLDRPSFERLKLLVGQQFNHLQETISFKDAGREAEAEALVLSGRGKQLMDEVRRISQRELEISQAQLESTRKDLEAVSDETQIHIDKLKDALKAEVSYDKKTLNQRLRYILNKSNIYNLFI